MKLGVFGGTFDPIHVGHLIIAEKVTMRLGLDKVIFIPAGRPYFKAGQEITEAEHRLAMVRLAVESNNRFEVSDAEVTRPGPTFTADTLRDLRRALGVEMYLILGLDSLKELAQWRRPAEILQLATLVGVPRTGAGDFDPETLDSIFPGASKRIVVLDGPLIDVSGTEIRRRAPRGEPIRDLVPEPVEAYIREHGLYARGQVAKRSGRDSLRG